MGTPFMPEDLVDHVAVHIGQAVIATVMAVGQLLVIQTHEIQDGGMKVVDMDFVLNGVPAVLVGSAVNHSTLHAPARQPHGEAEGMVFPAIISLGGRRAPELAAPEYQRVIEQS